MRVDHRRKTIFLLIHLMHFYFKMYAFREHVLPFASWCYSNKEHRMYLSHSIVYVGGGGNGQFLYKGWAMTNSLYIFLKFRRLSQDRRHTSFLVLDANIPFI